jgi:hypothetical protein
MHLDDVDAALTHLVTEIEMIALGVLHPRQLVEQQRVAIGRRQSRVRQPWRAHEHFAKLPDLRMNAELNGFARG